MMPLYNPYMDSYPHQRNQTGYRSFPAYTHMDPTKSPLVHEPWPYNGSYGYPAPCHSCCNHGNFPGFHGFRPSYPHPLPSPVHHFGGYPTPYHEAYPVTYAPPPHYSMELPRYESDKNTPCDYHCCGCPNHSCHQKEDRRVKIEEQELDVADKKGNNSLVPAQAKQYPYPVVWIPQEYLKEQRRPIDPMVAEPERFPSKSKPLERENSQEPERNLWNGWFPLDADKLRYLIHGGDEKRSDDQKKEGQKEPVIVMPYDGRGEEVEKKDKKDVNANQYQNSEDQMQQMRQFPFPIVWMPTEENKHEEAGGKDSKEVSGSPKVAENQPFTFKFFPVKYLGGDSSTDNPKVNETNIASQNGTEVRDDTATQKNIPVKQIDQPRKEVEKSEEKENRSLTCKPSETNGKRQSSSPSKLPKLPPACLRVDPLPRKKIGNGSSRSPSPPGGKERSQKNSNEMKVSQDPKLHESAPSESKKVEAKKKEPKEVVVTEKMTDGSNVEVLRNGTRASVDSSIHTNAVVTEKRNREKADKDGDECQVREDTVANKVDKMSHEETEQVKDSVERKLENKTLSDVEASVRIQSAYRGFMIRKSEPLKKLKQIAEVREQVVDVRNRIQALESAPEVQSDEKQKVVIGETIMRLLLKLDTIQGLLPCLREIRKSLANELVTLQEKLDSIVIKKFEQPIVEERPVEPVEELVSKAENNEIMLKQEKQEETGGNESSDDVPKSVHDVISSNQSEKTLLSPSDNTSSPMLSEGNTLEPSVASDLEPKEPKSEATVEKKEVVGDRAPEVCKADSMDKQEVDNVPELKQAEETPLKDGMKDSDVQENSLEATKATCVDDQETKLDALPLIVVDDHFIESDKDKQVEMESATAYGVGKFESTIPSEVSLPSAAEGFEATQENSDMNELAELPIGAVDGIEGLMAAQEMSKMNELAELPIGAIDDDLVSSAEMERNDDQLSKVSECQSTTEGKDDNPNENEKPEEVQEEKPIAETEEVVEVGFGYEENKESLMDETPLLKKSEESQPLISLGEEGIQNVLHENDHVSARPKDMLTEKIGDDKSLPVVITDEDTKDNQEMKVPAGDELEISSDEKMNDKSYGSEITKDEASFSPGLNGQGGQERESLLAKPTWSQMSNEESEMLGSINDQKLIEENEKMREMMEKLIEAGKQQLNVISNLNGRVKDLEKKLSKKRILRTKQSRASRRGSSRVKCSNVAV